MEVTRRLTVELPYDLATPLVGYVYKRTESRAAKRYLYTHIHGNMIHSGQKVKAT